MPCARVAFTLLDELVRISWKKKRRKKRINRTEGFVAFNDFVIFGHGGFEFVRIFGVHFEKGSEFDKDGTWERKLGDCKKKGKGGEGREGGMENE